MMKTFRQLPTVIWSRRLRQLPIVLWSRRRLRNPWENPQVKTLILHGTYHKMGTVWFRNVLTEVCNYFGLRFHFSTSGAGGSPPPGVDLFLQAHSQLVLDGLDRFVGTHMIRDPRDVAVSGYYYHLWTREAWANRPMRVYDHHPNNPLVKAAIVSEKNSHLSYREYLNKLDVTEGLGVEIRRFTADDMARLKKWNFNDKRFLHLKYEEIINDEEAWFSKIFRHYGFSEPAANTAVAIARRFSLKRLKKNSRIQSKSHIRSGKSGQWQQTFEPVHKELFKRLNGQELIRLGYTKDYEW